MLIIRISVPSQYVRARLRRRFTMFCHRSRAWRKGARAQIRTPCLRTRSSLSIHRRWAWSRRECPSAQVLVGLLESPSLTHISTNRCLWVNMQCSFDESQLEQMNRRREWLDVTPAQYMTFFSIPPKMLFKQQTTTFLTYTYHNTPDCHSMHQVPQRACKLPCQTFMMGNHQLVPIPKSLYVVTKDDVRRLVRWMCSCMLPPQNFL